MVNDLKTIIEQSTNINNVINNLKSESEIVLKGLSGSLKSLFLSILKDKINAPIIYITGDDEQEELVREDMELLIGSENVAFFPQYKELVFDKGVIDSTRKSQLVSSLEKIVQNRNSISILTAKNIIRKFPSPDWFSGKSVRIIKNSEMNFDILKEKIINLGFTREPMVESWGEMSVRGGIIDIFPFSSENPFRIEFFGDMVESIRVFNPTTQRSVEFKDEMVIYPQFPEDQEVDSNNSLVSIFDYFPDNSLIFLDEIEIIKKQIQDFIYSNKNENIFGKGLNVDDIFVEKYLTWEKLESQLKEFKKVVLDSFAVDNFLDLRSRCQESLRGNVNLLKHKIEFFLKKEDSGTFPKIYFLCDSQDQVERINEIFEEAGIDCTKINICNFGVNQGFILDEIGVIVFTDNQFYGRSLRWRRRKKIRKGLTVQQLNSLNTGDYVVHIDKGIGQYKGLKKIMVNRSERECLTLNYRDGDLLYVPLDKMNRVQKYSAKDGVIPVLSKLGSAEWDLLKKKTKKRIKEIANDLIKIYAERKAQNGYSFAKDTLWQRELEASFDYEDTPDQIRATEDLKTDMESSYPMDRLICGDVGFGKTEVALRGAFKAVNDNKQVAVLVPTTILALQHYSTFRDRLQNFPVKIEMISRFKTNSEQKRIVKQLETGEIDIIIGTHRLLSKDIKFKCLGLLVVDEEHRFGVRNKEKLKGLYSNVDVLSMSATPIPRTLNMALLGIRDMSIINTPPHDRLPIHTEVSPFDKKLIRMAVLKEIERGGQVFFVHNRVQSIDSIADLLRRIVPEVSVVVAHGQMDEKKLEKVMWDFAMRKYQCLVSTMIIESGLDIPNVNTLIVNRADRFGLSQLYQLRGRVGRGNQLAYAYFLIPPFNLLNHDAIKRMRIIEEFTDLGSGFKIAMKDLEIRGAGNILGSEQSGKIAALGYEMYTKIIEEAVHELKLERDGKNIPEKSENDDTKVEINADAFLPDEYIEQPELKVDIYRRLANEKDLQKISEIRDEVVDRFGRLPLPASNLFHLIDLKIIGIKLDLRLIKITDHKLTCYYSDKFENLSRELKEKNICSIMEKAMGNFHFIQDTEKRLGIALEIPKEEKYPIVYSKNFLINLI